MAALHPSKSELLFEHISFYLVESYLNGVPELLKLSQTSKYMRQTFCHSYYVRIILERNMNSLLLSFGINFSVLQDLLNSTEPKSIVSGSIVLQAYIGEQWETSDIDIYVPLLERLETPEILPLSSDTSNTTSSALSSQSSNLFNTVIYDSDNIEATMQKYLSSLSSFVASENNRLDNVLPMYAYGFINYIRSVQELDNEINQRKLQLIYVEPTEYACVEFVVQTFDLTMVANFYNGSNWKFHYFEHIILKTMQFLPQYPNTREFSYPTRLRIEKYTSRGFKFVKTNKPNFINEMLWSYVNQHY